ncbi:hypothetical protein [Hyphobacterium vulgare]|uniref:SPOR domain-containing protein n=1 Tax=Hyphobacterium vulgare TaxID=1736751 RepID=A0ABV6ZWL3_9PROT
MIRLALILALMLPAPALAQVKPGTDGLPPIQQPGPDAGLQGAPPPGSDGAFLIAPYIDFSEREQAAFHARVVPMLTLEHPMTNTGNAASPWYCFAFADLSGAELARRRIANERGLETLAAQLMIAEDCAAG